MDNDLLSEILSLDRKTIATFFKSILHFDEERAIRRWRLCTFPMLVAVILRLIFGASLAYRFQALVSTCVILIVDRIITKRYLSFLTYQWFGCGITFALVVGANYSAQKQYGFTWLEAYTNSTGPFLPTIALFYLSGGPPGFLLSFLNLGYLILLYYLGPQTPMERDKVTTYAYGWALQTTLGVVWISFENSTHGMLKGALKTALDSNAAKTKFVAWLSHDLRTPLVGMFGFLDELAQDTKPTPEQKELVEKIRVCTDSVNGLITNLLDFSMLESGVFNLKPTVFNLRNSLQYQCSMLQPFASKKNIRIDYRFWDLTPASEENNTSQTTPLTNSSASTDFLHSSFAQIPVPVFVVGDWLRLQQLLTNLVTNSIKYSDAGSQVLITCTFKMQNIDGLFMPTPKLTEKHEITNVTPTKMMMKKEMNDDDNSLLKTATTTNIKKEKSTASRANETSISPVPPKKSQARRFSLENASGANFVNLEICVEDQGCGIPAADIPLIFDPFFQVIRNSQKGSGLGLFIVREIIKAMGGSITCTSQVGKGTKFTVSQLKFPIASEAQVRQHIHRSTDRLLDEEAKKVRILLAEDNATNQQVLKRLLTKSMFQFKIVNDGQEAVDEWQKNPRAYDLILMDLQMPNKNGIEATKEIRQIEKSLFSFSQQSIPIVALTATTYPEELDNAIQSGMAEFLIKPIDQISLDECVTRLVKSKPNAQQEELESSVKESLSKYKNK